jgi:hypothetical protein
VFICSKYVHLPAIEVRQTKTGKIAYVCFPRHLRPRLYPTACMTDLQPVVLVGDRVVPRQLHSHQHATHACLLPNFPEHTSLNASLPRMHCSSMPPIQSIPAAFQPCSFGRKASTRTMFYRPCIWCCLQLLHPTDSPCLQLLCNEQLHFFAWCMNIPTQLHPLLQRCTFSSCPAPPMWKMRCPLLSMYSTLLHNQPHMHRARTCNAMSHIMLLCTELVQHPAALSASPESYCSTLL